jgi:hypothetical protein
MFTKEFVTSPEMHRSEEGLGKDNSSKHRSNTCP